MDSDTGSSGGEHISTAAPVKAGETSQVHTSSSARDITISSACEMSAAQSCAPSGLSRIADETSDRTAQDPTPGDVPAYELENDNTAVSESSSGEGAGKGTGESPVLSMVHAPLQKLWKLERLQMARQQEDLRGARGDPKTPKPGEHATHREEQILKQDLQHAMRALILAAEPGDSFILETLLRAVEAGHEDSMGSPVVRQFLASSRRRAQAAAQHEAGQEPGFLEPPLSRAAVALVMAMTFGIVRQLHLAGRLQRALGGLVGRWRNIWGRHLASTPAGSVMRRLNSRSIPPSSLPRPRSLDPQGSLIGFNAMARGSKRSWWQPWTWFGTAAASAAVPVFPSAALLQGPGNPLLTSGPSGLDFHQSLQPLAKVKALATAQWQTQGGSLRAGLGSRSVPSLVSYMNPPEPGAAATLDLCSIPRAGVIQQAAFSANREKEWQGPSFHPSLPDDRLAQSSPDHSANSSSTITHSSSAAGLLHSSSQIQPVRPLKADFLTARSLEDLQQFPRIAKCKHSRSMSCLGASPSAAKGLGNDDTRQLGNQTASDDNPAMGAEQNLDNSREGNSETLTLRKEEPGIDIPNVHVPTLPQTISRQPCDAIVSQTA